MALFKRTIKKGIVAAGALVAVMGLPLVGCGDDEPTPVYGVQTCETDQECIDENGAGWYCDKDDTLMCKEE
jgi:hypothetical protein